MKELYCFEISMVPNIGINKELFLTLMRGVPFAILYNMARKTTHIAIAAQQQEAYALRSKLCKSMHGFDIQEPIILDGESVRCFAIYRKQETLELPTLHDVFECGIDTGYLAIAFVPAPISEIEKAKTGIEKLLGSKPMRQTVSAVGKSINSQGSSYQHEIFEASEEREILTAMLMSINNALLTNGLAYKVCAFVCGPKQLDSYIGTHFAVLKTFGMARNIQSAFNIIRDSTFVPFGIDQATSFVTVHGSVSLNYIVDTNQPPKSEGIVIGKYLEKAVTETDNSIAVGPSVFNLGTILTGVPGTGKTTEAMSLVHQILECYEKQRFDSVYRHRPFVVIIAATDEWNGFGYAHDMHVIRPFCDNVPINFFACPDSIDVAKFYENLAMILSTASNAGPYKNPMEKCMINSFRIEYAATRQPDPVVIYNQIEKAIIKLHAKTSNTGVKYTKHGENIRSALEGLRAVLHRPEYTAQTGINMAETISQGIVIDMSSVGFSSRSYIYALLLNQVYAVADQFALDGDDKLRMLICIEEAQLLFNSKAESAVQDLAHRVQNFRKQGIALMLLLHNVTDVEQSIRRLCQIKIYLKQSADVAVVAAKDLMFRHELDDQIVDKLKRLDSRVAAINYMIKAGNDKISCESVFVKTSDYDIVEQASNPIPISYPGAPKAIRAKIRVNFIQPEQAKKLTKIRILYLNESIAEELIEQGRQFYVNMIKNKPYTFEFLDSRLKVIKSLDILAKPELVIDA